MDLKNSLIKKKASKWWNLVDFERLMGWYVRPAELTAKFIDAKLRTGGKGQSEEDLELILDQVLTIFRFIQVSQTFHQN